MIDDAGVDLGGGEFGVAEHLANRLNRHSICIGYGRSECVASKVRGYSFLDAQCGGYLFEVEVVLGIAQYWEKIAVNAGRLVLFQD